jgi:hypothetical protein
MDTLDPESRSATNPAHEYGDIEWIDFEEK